MTDPPLPYAVLGGNLFGVSSFLLGLDDGATAGRLRLDVLVPVKGFKRCVDYQNGYGEFFLCLFLLLCVSPSAGAGMLFTMSCQQQKGRQIQRARLPLTSQ
jgi:hypothetical protein